jgi:amidase/aspartyl-tRNA(Asn)/glutamyl-tRNA(Gln) amidotransferase subunit A
MSLADDLAYTSASELASLIRNRRLSPLEAVDAFAERIEERNDSINAFVYLDLDEARGRARAAERALASGEELGLLHGVPTAMKDLFDFKPGWPATLGGVRALADWRPDLTCLYVERVEAAGAIVLGKTNSPVLGMRGVCDNPLFGPSRNPFDLTRNTGGSSGGSAGAVADGLVPFAEGGDAGGSIRIPAAWCGVYGYKASWGRVPVVMRPNAFGGTLPFVCEGPITRTVDDAALVLTAISGPDPRDPYSLDERLDFTTATRRSLKGARIAYSADLDVFPVEDTVRRTVDQAVQAFTEAGATVEPVRVGLERSQGELSDLWWRLMLALTMPALEGMRQSGVDLLGEHRADLPRLYLDWVERYEGYDVGDLARDQAIRTEVYDAIEGVLAGYDLLVTPTLACMPVENRDDGDTIGPAEIGGEPVDPGIGWCLTYVTNFSGHPSCSIPAGLADGLPVGMQIIGRRGADADVLAASAVFERLRPWQQTYRLCAERPLAEVGGAA